MSKSKKPKGTLERVTETVSGAAEAVWDAGASAIETVSGALPGAKSSPKKKSSKAKSSASRRVGRSARATQTAMASCTRSTSSPNNSDGARGAGSCLPSPKGSRVSAFAR